MKNNYLAILLLGLCSLAIIYTSCSKDDPIGSGGGGGGGTDTPTCTDGVQNGIETGVDCGGDCMACPSSGNEILAITFENSPGDFDPIIEIDNNLKEVWMRIGKVFPTADITNLNFDVEVSAGATVPNLPSDFSDPQTVEVVAEDGSSQNYKFIVSGAYGTLSKVGNGTSSFEEARGIYKYARVSESNKVYITLQSDISLGSFYYYQWFISLDNVTLSNSIVGDYNLDKWFENSPHGCFFEWPNNGGTDSATSPRDGYLKITKHDMVNKLISGQVLDLKYGSVGIWNEHYPYAEFINLRYE